MWLASQGHMEKTWRNVTAIAAIAGATLASAVLGGVVTRKGKPWYRLLRKSAANPPDAVFGPVWTVLYGLSTVSATRVYLAPKSPERTRALSLWSLQQALNGGWSPLFFGKHRARLALADITLLIAAQGGYTLSARHVDRTAAALGVPYLAWLGFAAFLNEEVVRQNPKLLAG
jgi:tryptophan-rich sensory protein